LSAKNLLPNFGQILRFGSNLVPFIVPSSNKFPYFAQCWKGRFILCINFARPYHLCITQTFSNPTRIFGTGGSKNLRRICPIAVFAYKFLIFVPKCANIKHLCRRDFCRNGINFTKIEQGSRPSVSNFAIFSVVWAGNPNYRPINMKFGTL